MAQQQAQYPVRFEVDYPITLSRLSTAFRLILLIPIGVIVLLLDNGSWIGNSEFTLPSGGLLVAAPLVMILFRKKYPRWWFDWNVALLQFQTRVSAYFLLLRDQFPSTDEDQGVHLSIDYPNAETDLNRWLPLVKWLLAIPHYVVLLGLVLAAAIMLIVAWFAILFTGRYPRGLFSYQVGVTRWLLRVEAYAFLLVTDRYPPFNLGA